MKYLHVILSLTYSLTLRIDSQTINRNSPNSNQDNIYFAGDGQRYNENGLANRGAADRIPQKGVINQNQRDDDIYLQVTPLKSFQQYALPTQNQNFSPFVQPRNEILQLGALPHQPYYGDYRIPEYNVNSPYNTNNYQIGTREGIDNSNVPNAKVPNANLQNFNPEFYDKPFNTNNYEIGSREGIANSKVPNANLPNINVPNANVPNDNVEITKEPIAKVPIVLTLPNANVENVNVQNADLPNFNAPNANFNVNTNSRFPEQNATSSLLNVSQAITHFGLALLKNINQGENNVVISPFSIGTLLALLQQGAQGETQRQISEALQLWPETASEAFKKLIEDVHKRGSHNILRLANNVFVAETFEINKEFKHIARTNFGSEVTPLDVRRPKTAVRQINQWVADKTNNNIKELLSQDAVSSDSELVLVNAVYFKGVWQVKFKPDSTLDRAFHLANGETKNVKFMRMRRIFRNGVDRSNNAQVIVLPFENDEYSFLAVLPSESSSLSVLISKLSDTQLAGYLKFTPKEVDLEIPKFTIRGDTNLNPLFVKMGMSNIFTQQADLSRLGTPGKFSPQVSSALHTAMLSIDEQGGSAAAATSFAVVALSYDDPSIFFKANRPFLAVLWDNRLSMPLFMARIEDPLL